LELGELLRVLVSSVILAVVVEDVNGLFGEVLAQFLIVPQHVSQVGLLKIGVQSSIPESNVEQEPGHSSQNLESEGHISELVEEKRGGGQHVEGEGVLDSASSVPPGLESWKPSKGEILAPGPEQRRAVFNILWLFNMSGLKTVFGVSVVSVFPFELPSLVVWIS